MRIFPLTPVPEVTSYRVPALRPQTSYPALQRFVTYRGCYRQVPAAIRKARADVAALEPVLKSIRMRRDEWLAHIDQRTVSDSSALAARAALTIPDLERAFDQTEHIVLELSSLYDSTIGDLRYLGGDDYETALEWIRRAKCSFIEQYERQFGSWTGPRPKDCSQ